MSVSVALGMAIAKRLGKGVVTIMASFESLFQPTIDRLAHLLMRQYGCEMVYLHSTDLEAALLPKFHNQLVAGQTVMSGEKLFIPVFLNSRLAGAAQVNHAYDLPNSDLQLMRQIVQTVIESTLSNLDRLELIAELERQLEHVEQSQNVLPMSHYRANPYPLENRTRGAREQALDFACLIESKNPEDIFRMALEIHEHSYRYAFLNMRDLDEDVWTDIKELKRLGQISVFIDDISQLSLDRQQFLSEYLRQRGHQDGPQIIVGTTRTFRELRACPGILPQFLDLITVGYLHMSQPFSTYQKENLLDFFFEGLAGRSRSSADRLLDGMFDHNDLPPH